MNAVRRRISAGPVIATSVVMLTSTRVDCDTRERKAIKASAKKRRYRVIGCNARPVQKTIEIEEAIGYELPK
jgi:hypothetical protein